LVGFWVLRRDQQFLIVAGGTLVVEVMWAVAGEVSIWCHDGTGQGVGKLGLGNIS